MNRLKYLQKNRPLTEPVEIICLCVRSGSCIRHRRGRWWQGDPIRSRSSRRCPGRRTWRGRTAAGSPRRCSPASARPLPEGSNGSRCSAHHRWTSARPSRKPAGQAW